MKSLGSSISASKMNPVYEIEGEDEERDKTDSAKSKSIVDSLSSMAMNENTSNRKPTKNMDEL